MEKNPITEKLKEQLNEDFLGVEERTPRRIIVTIKPGAILKTAGFLYKDAGFRFIIASAIHTRRGFEIHYHFSRDQEGLILNLHVILDSENPRIESLSNMFNASNWIEREIHELFGIDFLNHPNQEKLISEGNWAEGVYPYRKNFKSTSDKKA
ncbi:MAG: NADH-quinone oxidoreductase subunit C [Bacteroidales bacterium]|nr:NADH-quinone oxidoreductase subunit C [Bacteroidales bacterium]